MPVVTVKAVSSATPYTVTLTDDLGHQWLADGPMGVGGANAGPSPARLLLSSLGAAPPLLCRYSPRASSGR